jgi:hypothetical protein
MNKAAGCVDDFGKLCAVAAMVVHVSFIASVSTQQLPPHVPAVRDPLCHRVDCVLCC